MNRSANMGMRPLSNFHIIHSPYRGVHDRISKASERRGSPAPNFPKFNSNSNYSMGGSPGDVGEVLVM